MSSICSEVFPRPSQRHSMGRQIPLTSAGSITEGEEHCGNLRARTLRPHHRTSQASPILHLVPWGIISKYCTHLKSTTGHVRCGMMTTNKLINVSITSHSFVTFCLILVRTLNISSLDSRSSIRNFDSWQEELQRICGLFWSTTPLCSDGSLAMSPPLILSFLSSNYNFKCSNVTKSLWDHLSPVEFFLSVWLETSLLDWCPRRRPRGQAPQPELKPKKVALF